MSYRECSSRCLNCLSLSSGSPSSYSLYPSDPPSPSPGALLAEGDLLSRVTRCSRPILLTSCSGLGSRYFSEEPWFFFVGITDPGLGSAGAQRYLTHHCS